jgi:hypothetical protein
MLIGVLLFWGCKSTGSIVPTRTPDYSSYQEDLSNSLPEFPDYMGVKSTLASQNPEVSIQSVDGQLQRVQREVYDRNRTDLYFNGFSVLVYSGVDRDRAFKTQQELTQYFPDIQAEMQYQQPRYLVKIGRYSYRFEAQKVFSQIKGVFPSARIVPDRFQRKEYISPTTIDHNVEKQN